MIFTRNSCSVVLLENLELPYRIPTLQQNTQQGEIIKLTGFYSIVYFYLWNLSLTFCISLFDFYAATSETDLLIDSGLIFFYKNMNEPVWYIICNYFFLKGRICGIDEKTALFWKVCNLCESNNFEESSNKSRWIFCSFGWLKFNLCFHKISVFSIWNYYWKVENLSLDFRFFVGCFQGCHFQCIKYINFKYFNHLSALWIVKIAKKKSDVELKFNSMFSCSNQRYRMLIFYVK